MTLQLDAPTVTARIDANPCPRVEVTVTPKADTVTVTVWRSSAAGRVQVRGAYRLPLSGPLLVVDYEAPFGDPATYSATAYDGAGTAATESPSSAAAILAVPGCPWVQDPTDPASAMVWIATDWPDRTFGRDSAELWPVASKTAVVLTGPRRAPISTMTVITRTLTAADGLLALADVPVVLVRTDPAWRWRGGYFAMGEVVETGRVYDPTHPDQLWTVPLTPTVAPPPDMTVPLYTWADVKRLYATWADVKAAKATWQDLLRNPDPGGN